MLALYIVNWVLFIINYIVLEVCNKELDEDEGGWCALTTIFGVGIPFNIYYILEALFECDKFSGYKDYMRKASYIQADKIYLSFKQVKQFYIVNPQRWDFYHNVLLYTNSTDFVVLFRNPIQYYRTMRFFKNETAKSKAAQISKEDQNMKKFLEYMRKDIDALNAQAEKELNEAKQQLNTIRWV